MNGIQMALKAFGIQIPEESIRQIEHLLPQLPAKAQELIIFANTKAQDLDIRLRALEDAFLDMKQLQLEILSEIKVLKNESNRTESSKPAGGRRPPNGRAN